MEEGDRKEPQNAIHISLRLKKKTLVSQKFQKSRQQTNYQTIVKLFII